MLPVFHCRRQFFDLKRDTKKKRSCSSLSCHHRGNLEAIHHRPIEIGGRGWVEWGGVGAGGGGEKKRVELARPNQARELTNRRNH